MKLKRIGKNDDTNTSEQEIHSDKNIESHEPSEPPAIMAETRITVLVCR
jgi:hypothetical protein